jgi:hypothetical protein
MSECSWLAFQSGANNFCEVAAGISMRTLSADPHCSQFSLLLSQQSQGRNVFDNPHAPYPATALATVDLSHATGRDTNIRRVFVSSS